MGEAVLHLDSVTKTYGSGDVAVHALRDVTLSIAPGEFTVLAGPSGSGKTTLLNIMSGLDEPSSGTAFLTGKPISRMRGSELSDFRRDHIGFVFQAYNLIPVLTVEENIEYIMLLQGLPKEERRERVREILEDVGLGGKHDRRPHQLSGGQQQRVAVARAMASNPDIILADEPTANLDSATGGALLDMMRDLNVNRGMTFVFSSHEQMIIDRARRLIMMRDGEIESDETRG